MKKINKILNSLTLLSPLAGIGFNNQYQSVQKVITENCFSFNNYANSNAEPVKMGEIWVTVDESDPTIITGYSSGEGTLEVASNITKISNNAFNGRTQISSIDFSKATSLTTIGDGAFDSAGKESSEIFIPEKLSSIGFGAFNSWIFQSIEVAEGNQHFSLATNLGPNNKILVNNPDSLWTDDSTFFQGLAYGDVMFPDNLKIISDFAFSKANINSFDFSKASSIEIIGQYAFSSAAKIKNLDFSIMKNLQEIKGNAFLDVKDFDNGIKLDFRNLTKKLTLGDCIFTSSSKINFDIIGDIVFPKLIENIPKKILPFSKLDNNIYFTSETPPTFNIDWFVTKDEFTGKIYVPSEEVKQAYLLTENFGFDSSWVLVSSNSNTGLILGLVFGLGIPILAAVGFGIWYFTKKKKNNS